MSFSPSIGADANAKLHEHESGEASAETAKKVKKKDPITFDLFAALNATKKEKKAAAPAAKKPATTPTPVRNILDSGAPTKRRGKERERPKKKKRTPLKRQILETRAKRKKVIAANYGQENYDCTVSSKLLLQDRLAEAMAMTAVLNSLMHAENHENEPEVTKNETNSPLHVEPEVDTEVAGNSEPNGAVEPKTDALPEEEAREVTDHDARLEKVETPPAFIEAKKMLHKKKFREYVSVQKVSWIYKMLTNLNSTLLVTVTTTSRKNWTRFVRRSCKMSSGSKISNTIRIPSRPRREEDTWSVSGRSRSSWS